MIMDDMTLHNEAEPLLQLPGQKRKKKSILCYLIKGQAHIASSLFTQPGSPCVCSEPLFCLSVCLEGNTLALLAFIRMCDLFNMLSIEGATVFSH